ncbi:MAG TPA: class I SAM-dependent methyltransferase [Roseateles sp.]
MVHAAVGHLHGALALEWPGGQAGDPAATVRLRLHDSRALHRLARGEIGRLADDYVQGRLDIEGHMPDVMQIAAELAGDPVDQGRQGAAPHWLKRLRSRRRHHPERDAEAVQSHYDLSNDFFALWLDPLLVYSCAYYRDPAMSLAEAQQAKLKHICAKLQLSPGQRFLDVGAGWGGLLLWAAEHHGVQAVGITLSQNQHRHVNRLIDERGLRGRVEMRLLDYRDLDAREPFDRIASVGMFEHVGDGHLAAYFRHLYRLLAPGGLLLNHGITAGGLGHRQLGAGIGDFIEKHIFPGGELVHVSRVAHCLAEGGLELLDTENLRPHYARTLWDWSQALERQLDAARQLTDERRVRAYRMYLAGSAMSFERGWMALYQLLASRPDSRMDGVGMRGAQSVYPFNREHIYGGAAASRSSPASP